MLEHRTRYMASTSHYTTQYIQVLLTYGQDKNSYAHKMGTGTARNPQSKASRYVMWHI
jgi:hypothetical protein